MKTTKTILRRVARLAKGAATMVGAAVILAVVLGVGTTALAANGKPFVLGKNNVASAISTLTKQGPGPALRLLVRPGQPPMTVNSQVKVANLNADKIDGKDSSAFAHADTPTYQVTNGVSTGFQDGVASNSASCDDGDRILTGGYTNVSENGLVRASVGNVGRWDVSVQ